MMSTTKHRKIKVKARPVARKKLPIKAKVRPAAKAKAAHASMKAARKEQIAKVLAKLKLLPKNKTGKPQKLDKVTLKKALLKERLARAKVEGKPRSTRGLTARERALVKEFERRELSPADAEARRTRLKNLIVLGKERSYLTYAEINDHLPDDMMDAEQIETIISMINDMGVQVYDEAPDAETLLMSEVPAAVANEEAAEEAEAALSTVDSEFGRTTDPVRMYMREMGSVELLTREGEIEIAKRIEDGLRHMIQAISACPTTIAEILALADRIQKDEMRIDEVVDGLLDPNAEEIIGDEMADEAIEEELDAEEGEDEDGAAVQSASLLQLKAAALERFEAINHLYGKMMKSLIKHGSRSKPYLKAQEDISRELMMIRFSA